MVILPHVSALMGHHAKENRVPCCLLAAWLLSDGVVMLSAVPDVQLSVHGSYFLTPGPPLLPFVLTLSTVVMIR